ncbi:hypothetical protein [Oceanobacillus sp. FSL H7-0719]|uniref:hypothetical protein n=1 Tax=Oceanobacillus sp. FSL H7-0719 TaxID=2954507 RepID=UPI00324B6003
MLGNLFKTKTMTEHEMQLWLDKKGYRLYNPKIDNKVDPDELAMLAIDYGFKWADSKELWIKERLF